jgi:3-dehydrotetronate 4-kinase
VAVEVGVIADDFTGACDLAAAVSRAGLPVTVLLDPAADIPDVPCVVLALKSRTTPVAEAIAESVAAARALRRAGASRIYQKYCSTFDSTDAGNIGPVAEALMAEIGAESNLTTPATPEVGRTVYLGHLFVGDRLLSESSLRHHPLTPMTDADLVRVLGRQTSLPVSRGRLGPGHVILDAVSDSDLDSAVETLLARADRGLVDLWGGGAGLAAAIARGLTTAGSSVTEVAVPSGPRLVLSGSCSEQTQGQVAAFSGPAYRVAPGDVDGAIAFLARSYGEDPGRPALVYSTAPREEQLQGRADEIEATLATVGAAAAEAFGIGQLLVAGGETSGAVCRRLGLRALDIREHVGPGLAWCSPQPDPGLRVLLKSGNFGRDDLFDRAWL